MKQNDISYFNIYFIINFLFFSHDYVNNSLILCQIIYKKPDF